MEQERRLSREIANSNERRRMQSINSGYQTLLEMLKHPEGTLSKAAILQQTAQRISQLIREKTKCLNQKAHYLKLLSQKNGESLGSSTENDYSADDIGIPLPKRIKTLDGAIELGDESNGSMNEENIAIRDEIVDLKRENLNLKMRLEQEKRLRLEAEKTWVAAVQGEYLHQQQRSHSNENNEIYSARNRSVDTSRQIIDETPRCYTVRNNLETILEAIRHLEGKHLFQDGYGSASTSPDPTSPRSTSPAVAMEVCNSSSNSPNDSQSTIDLLTPTSSSFNSSASSQQQGSGSYSPNPPSTIVTSLKNHVLSRNPRSDTDEKVINLEYVTDVGVTKSAPSFTNQQPIAQFQTQQQTQNQPGVIVVKHF